MPAGRSGVRRRLPRAFGQQVVDESGVLLAARGVEDADFAEQAAARFRPAVDIGAGFDKDTVARVARMLDLAEYKRRQSAPGVKVTLRNFGRDRRYPIVNKFRDRG